MTGDRDLGQLLRHLAPSLHPETFVFCSLPDFQVPPDVAPICTLRETEGLSVIVEREQAVRAGIPHVFAARLITLNVHSSLDAIGLLAVVAGRFAEAGVPCNVVAGYHHDHLFVPTHLAEEAMEMLKSLTRERREAPSGSA